MNSTRSRSLCALLSAPRVARSIPAAAWALYLYLFIYVLFLFIYYYNTSVKLLTLGTDNPVCMLYIYAHNNLLYVINSINTVKTMKRRMND